MTELEKFGRDHPNQRLISAQATAPHDAYGVARLVTPQPLNAVDAAEPPVYTWRLAEGATRCVFHVRAEDLARTKLVVSVHDVGRTAPGADDCDVVAASMLPLDVVDDEGDDVFGATLKLVDDDNLGVGARVLVTLRFVGARRALALGVAKKDRFFVYHCRRSRGAADAASCNSLTGLDYFCGAPNLENCGDGTLPSLASCVTPPPPPEGSGSPAGGWQLLGYARVPDDGDAYAAAADDATFSPGIESVGDDERVVAELQRARGGGDGRCDADGWQVAEGLDGPWVAALPRGRAPYRRRLVYRVVSILRKPRVGAAAPR